MILHLKIPRRLIDNIDIVLECMPRPVKRTIPIKNLENFLLSCKGSPNIRQKCSDFIGILENNFKLCQKDFAYLVAYSQAYLINYIMRNIYNIDTNNYEYIISVARWSSIATQIAKEYDSSFDGVITTEEFMTDISKYLS